MEKSMSATRIVGLSAAIVMIAAALASAAGDARLAAAMKINDKAAARQLLKQRADVNTADVEGMTALHWAAHWNDLDTAKLLIRAGASAKAANRYGVTPLHEASTLGSVPMIEALLKAGADPNAPFG